MNSRPVLVETVAILTVVVILDKTRTEKTVNPDLALTLPTLANAQPTSEEETNLKNLS